MKFAKQSTTFLKPFVPTPPTHHNYRLGILDEAAPFLNVVAVLFFSPISDQDINFVIRLEKSLEKTLSLLYPLAGRYVDETQTIKCNDEGVEFIHAKVNIKLQEILASEMDPKSVDEFIKFNTRVADNLTGPLLSIQVTKFECGGLAIGLCATHKIVDASTLCTFFNDWAAINREESEIEFSGSCFNSTSLFPAHGLRRMDLPTINSDDMLSKYTRKKFAFSESEISKIRENYHAFGFSKVQLVMAIISKAFIDLDHAIYKYSRESIVVHSMNLRGKMASLIPKDSCGNFWAYIVTKSVTFGTIIELAELIKDSTKKDLSKYSKVRHDTEEGQSMIRDITLPFVNFPEFKESFIGKKDNPHMISFTSWCKFPFYEANFGFGKPIWVAPGTKPLKNIVTLLDDATGSGVEAHVLLEQKDVRAFEESLNVNALRA